MIEIRYTESQDTFRLTMSGHAEYAEAGKDIVCAGASTLLFTLINHLELIGEAYNCDYSKGYAEVAAWGRQGRDAFDVIMTGFRMLSTKYPDRVQVFRDMHRG